MKTVGALIKRNVKIFFKDKGTFFTSLATPIILLVLYVTFLYNVYEDSFTASLPEGVAFDPELLDGLVGGLLLSSLLAVSTVTVSFCANLCMVADKVSGARADFTVAPIKPHTLALGYYIATAINGLIVSAVATLLGFAYLAFTGWYLSILDVLALFSDIFLMVLFGTALSSLVCYPLTTQGQVSAVGTVVSAGYGFICGAYMPISQFSTGLKNTLMFLPGTYGTSLLRNHALRGVYAEMSKQGFPAEAVDAIKSTADCDLEFFGHSVEIWQMYLVLVGAIVLLVGGYILLHTLRRKGKNVKKV
ncbi:MAG: ABC transporter permease [Clostridia bacterium]|nr:ABC transporter permease [Clostridia bacterium]